MNHSPRAPKLLVTTLAVVAALGLAACGNSDANGSSATAATSSSGGETVSTATIDGSQVLVDANGNALYTPDQEANGKIMCTGSCEAIWMPLTTGAGAKPTAAADVSGTLGTIKRPDGSLQVTLAGAPLYTFAEDGGPGKVTGDGVSDQFGSKSFTWQVVGAGGSTESEPAETTTSSSSRRRLLLLSSGPALSRPRCDR